jgi:hypothetical protein
MEAGYIQQVCFQFNWTLDVSVIFHWDYNSVYTQMWTQSSENWLFPLRMSIYQMDMNWSQRCRIELKVLTNRKVIRLAVWNHLRSPQVVPNLYLKIYFLNSYVLVVTRSYYFVLFYTCKVGVQKITVYPNKISRSCFTTLTNIGQWLIIFVTSIIQ